MKNSELAQTILEKIKPRLFDLGFKYTKDGFVRKETDEFNTRVTFGMATRVREGMIQVNPRIGLIHQEINRIYKALVGGDPKYETWAISNNVGYILQQIDAYKEWDFYDNDIAGNEQKLEEMIASVKEAVQLMQQYLSLGTIYEGLQRPHFGGPDSFEIRMVILALQGKKEEGEKILQERIAKAERPGELRQYEIFYESYRNYKFEN